MKAMAEREGRRRRWRLRRSVSYTGYVGLFSALLKHLVSNDTLDYFQPQLRGLLRAGDTVSSTLGEAMYEAYDKMI